MGFSREWKVKGRTRVCRSTLLSLLRLRICCDTKRYVTSALLPVALPQAMVLDRPTSASSTSLFPFVDDPSLLTAKPLLSLRLFTTTRPVCTGKCVWLSLPFIAMAIPSARAESRVRRAMS